MKFDKKTLAIILVATIGSSVFMGTAFAAAGGNSPFTEILTLLGIIDGKLDTIQAKLEGTTQILSYNKGYQIWDADGFRHVANTHITASKPVLFTVTVYLSRGVGATPGNLLYIFEYDTPSTYAAYWTDTTEATHTVTFGGTDMEILGVLNANCGVYWRIMVQGSSGTVITVMP